MKRTLLLATLLLPIAAGALVGCSGGSNDKSGTKLEKGDYMAEPGKGGSPVTQGETGK